VTQLDYVVVMRKSTSRFADRGIMFVHGLVVDPYRPVETTSWHEAQEFVTRLNVIESKKPPGAKRYRYFLPSEAQWEYATKAGTDTAYFNGNDPARLAEIAWYSRDGIGPGRTMPVGLKLPNANGLYDASGNVWEWVADKYVSDPTKLPAVDPKSDGDKNAERVCRGGSWYSGAQGCRSARRYDDSPDYRVNDRGFRVARALVSP